MRHYKIPKWTQGAYPGAVWDFFSDDDKSIYLTFDDGPEPEVTPLILDILRENDVKATFFCLGKNVMAYPEILHRILDEGHAIGNHGMEHLNGLKTANQKYLQNAVEARDTISSELFRPPYGKLNRTQFGDLKKAGFKVVFWTIMAYDFDSELESEKRIEKIKSLSKAGSIVVFHDNIKSKENVLHDLPLLLDFWKSNHYTFKTVC